MNEAIEKHDELNQKIFDSDKLKPEVRQKAEEIVNEFLKALAEDEVKLTVRDVILTGSNASFNYNAQSDIDLHILAKTIDLDDPDKLYPKLYNCYRRMFESKFDITFYGIPVEVYVETEDNPVVSNGIYSVMYDKWIKTPQKSYVPDIDEEAIKKAAKPWLDEANELLRDADDNMPNGDEKIDAFFEDLYELRHRGIYDTEGSEFSEENLIFKEVRASGVMDKLKDLRNTIVAKKLSLEEAIKYLDDEQEFMDYGTAEVDGESVIDVNKASTFGTQDLLDGSEDSTYDGVTYDIVDLTPTQYFELCSKIQNMTPDELIDLTGVDSSRITHIKDVILKYNRRLPLPFVSFSKNGEVGGQEGRHRMYALGEMYGWDQDFPVMVVQDAANKKTIGELLHESIMEDFSISEKDRREYAIKIAQLTRYQPIVQPNGLFELYNVKEDDLPFLMATLRRQDWIDYVRQSAERYDFSRMSYAGLPSRYHKIIGKIRN